MPALLDAPVEHVDVGEVVLRLRRVGPADGDRPPVVLLHGHPRTHTTWHRLAPLLATGRTVVCPDLRGYGGSGAPHPRGDHTQASKRAMADDVVRLLRVLGHERFAVVGHDRGSYVAQRLAADHPGAVTHLGILDSVPIGAALSRADARFAGLWWHWFFLGGPVGLAERVISADPVTWYGLEDPARRRLMGDENLADLRAAVTDPAVVQAMCEDYRAGLGPDRAADDADRAAGRRITCPTLVLWASGDDLPGLYGDPLPVWREWAVDVTGGPLPGGHHLAEEVPELVAAALRELLDR